MSLPYDEARCTGQQCPSAANCRRHTERQIPKGVVANFAPLYLRREAGADACDQYMPVVLVSTFSPKTSDEQATANAVARIFASNCGGLNMNAEQLKKFCAVSDIRHYLMAPIRRDGRLFATNGHILVSIPDNPEIKAGKEGPNLAKFIKEVEEKSFSPLVIVLPEPEPCKACINGKVSKCEDCDGEGCFEHGDFSYECKACECEGFNYPHLGDGDMDCPYCDGTGHDPHQTVSVGHTTIARRYCEMMLGLQNCQIWTDEADSTATAYFKFDGGWGAVMPCREISEKGGAA